MRIILASASPRRRELMAQIGLQFEVKVSDIEENVTADHPCELVQKLALQKAEAVMADIVETGLPAPLLIIGADTVVSCGAEILGKPHDAEDAARMLRLLSGREHEVYTGVALLHRVPGKPAESRSFYESTTVRFAPMTEAELRAYIATGEPMDKAGAYGIQGLAARYITGITGDYNNVVGLPISRLYQETKHWLDT